MTVRHMRRASCVLVLLAAASLAAAQARAAGDPGVAALQVALHARGLYGGAHPGASRARPPPPFAARCPLAGPRTDLEPVRPARHGVPSRPRPRGVVRHAR